jgi:membrane protein
MERARQLQAGIEAEETIQLPPRDTRNSEKAAEKLEERVEEGRRIRMEARTQGASGHRAGGAGTGSDDGLEPLPSELARGRGR